MKTIITKGLPKDEAGEIKSAFLSAVRLRRRLVTLLDDKIDSHFRAQFNRDNYESPSWSLQQADSMGYVRALQEVVSLLSSGDKYDIPKKVRGRPRNEEKSPAPLV